MSDYRDEAGQVARDTRWTLFRFLPIFVFVLVILVAVPALAVDQSGISTTDIADTWGELTPQQRAEMATIIAQKAASAKTTAASVTVQEVEPWLVIIDKLGSGLVKLAHDMGVEANVLMKTPVGVLAMGLVVFHVAGDEVIEIFVGLLWFCMTFPFLALFYFKSVIPITEYANVEVTRFGKTSTIQKPVRRKMVFGQREGFNVDYMFSIVLTVNTFVTLMIIT